MLKQTIYVLIISLLTCCNNIEGWLTQDFVVQIKAKNSEAIYVNSLEGRVALQDQLKYYKRRYFGQISIEGKELVKIAQNTDSDCIATAKTAPEYNASTRILEKSKFIFMRLFRIKKSEMPGCGC